MSKSAKSQEMQVTIAKLTPEQASAMLEQGSGPYGPPKPPYGKSGA